MLDLSVGKIEEFKEYLVENERSRATIDKYIRDVHVLARFCGGKVEQKVNLIAFKDHLLIQGYAVTSINSMLASINSFLVFSRRSAWKLRFLKTQRAVFVKEDRELSRQEYMKLIKTAEEKGNDKLSLILQTICATGIRVSELRAITVESLKKGYTQIWSKGKVRQILIPAKLCQKLKIYCKAHSVRIGMVFITKSGNTIDRSNLWKMMKRLAAAAGVCLKKVFPHNLRHLFARTYYQEYRDIVHLADILGHSNMNTTRIYTVKNVTEQRMQMNRLFLLYENIPHN